MLIAEPAAPPPSQRPGALHRWLRTYAPALVLLLVGVGIWELVVQVLAVPEYLWPAPSDIGRAFHDNARLLLDNTGVTVSEVVLGFLIAVVTGLAFAVIIHLSPTLKRAVSPILIASQSIPTVVLAPVLVILLGFGIGPKLAIIGLFCFFPIVVNGVDGLASVDRDYIRMMLTLDASRFAILKRVEFPSALPLVFSGARIAAAYAAIGAVFGEWSGASRGLGFLMLEARPSLGTSLIFACVILLSAIALVLFSLVTLVERITIPWAREE